MVKPLPAAIPRCGTAGMITAGRLRAGFIFIRLKSVILLSVRGGWCCRNSSVLVIFIEDFFEGLCAVVQRFNSLNHGMVFCRSK